MYHSLRKQFSQVGDHDQGERYADESEEDAENPSQISRGHDVAVSCWI